MISVCLLFISLSMCVKGKIVTPWYSWMWYVSECCGPRLDSLWYVDVIMCLSSCTNLQADNHHMYQHGLLLAVDPEIDKHLYLRPSGWASTNTHTQVLTYTNQLHKLVDCIVDVQITILLFSTVFLFSNIWCYIFYNLSSLKSSLSPLNTLFVHAFWNNTLKHFVIWLGCTLLFVGAFQNCYKSQINLFYVVTRLKSWFG